MRFGRRSGMTALLPAAAQHALGVAEPELVAPGPNCVCYGEPRPDMEPVSMAADQDPEIDLSQELEDFRVPGRGTDPRGAAGSEPFGPYPGKQNADGITAMRQRLGQCSSKCLSWER